MRTSRLALFLSLTGTIAAAEEMTAVAIMQRVAENQERSVEARARWTYQQEAFVRLNRYNGKMAREERKEYAVLPGPRGIKKELLRCEGRYEDKGRIVSYSKSGFERKEMDIDAELVADLPEDLMTQDRSRDGLDPDLFPLTAERQRKYTFRLHGKEQYKDRDVWKIAFEPPKGEFTWAGEALIDASEYQPVLVTTRMSRGIPMAVRMMLGIDLQHLGFKVEYNKLENDVWFPVKYSGEFNLKVFFLYRRKIGISMRNSSFQKADVQSTIEYSLAELSTSGPEREAH